MLVAIARPEGWKKEQMLMRFEEENGTSTVFVVEDKALASFADCELWRIYDIAVSGRCVRIKSAAEQRFGVDNRLEVHMKFSCKISLAKVGWPLRHPYAFVAWADLNLLQDKAFFDIIGRVLEEPAREAGSKFPKSRLVLASGDLSQEIFLLGQYADMSLQVGDVLAVGGCRIKIWENVRSVETTFLSVLEKNPAIREGIPDVPRSGDGERPRKAMKLAQQRITFVEEAKQIMSRLVSDAPEGAVNSVSQVISLKGVLQKLDEDFFEKDAPLFGDEHQEKMCWNTSISDETGSVDLRVWDAACAELFGVTASTLRQLWEEGHCNAEHREKILRRLNANLDAEVTCTGKIKLSSYGFRTTVLQSHININVVELVANAPIVCGIGNEPTHVDGATELRTLCVSDAIAFLEGFASKTCDAQQSHVEGAFVVRGEFSKFKVQHFECDINVVFEDQSSSKCWQSVVSDGRCDTRVHVLSSACETIFGMQFLDLMLLWKAGLSNVEKREGIVTMLNESLNYEYACVCKIVFNVDELVDPEISKPFIAVSAVEVVAS